MTEFRFRNRLVILISPQTWDHLPVSKHHYARTLAAVGNEVYFIEPPLFGYKENTKYNSPENGVTIVKWGVQVPYWTKFYLPWVYKRKLREILGEVREKLDDKIVLINFDNDSYFFHEDLFKNSLRIFFPVDRLVNKGKEHKSSYDVVFSVSNQILHGIEHDKKYVIGHALNPEFAKQAKNKMDYVPDNENLKNVGYAGHMSIHSINKELILSLVEDENEIGFHFWGNYDREDEFVIRLKALPNVHFHGVKTGSELFNALSEMDMLFIAYRETDRFGMDNSHKVLEYFSTGLPVLSTRLSTYENVSVIEMADTEKSFRKKFEEIKTNYPDYIGPEICRSRREWALSNTYRQKIEEIEDYINSAEIK